MPLSKKRMRDRKRLDRSNLVKPKLVCLADIEATVTLPPCPIVKPATLAVKPDKREVLEKLLKLDGNRIVIVKPIGQPDPAEAIRPIYNPHIHKTGDLVRMRANNGKMIEVTVPELDGDGNPIFGL